MYDRNLTWSSLRVLQGMIDRPLPQETHQQHLIQQHLLYQERGNFKIENRQKIFFFENLPTPSKSFKWWGRIDDDTKKSTNTPHAWLLLTYLRHQEGKSHQWLHRGCYGERSDRHVCRTQCPRVHHRCK